MLTNAYHACQEESSIAEKEYAFGGTPLDLNVPMLVNILASGVQNRKLHVAQVHAFAGERASAEGMVFQAGPGQRRHGETLTATRPRLVIQRHQKKAVLDGIEYSLSPERFALLVPLAERPLTYVSSEELAKVEGAGMRPSSIRQDLPGPIKAIVTAEKGKGLKMDLAPNLIRLE